MALTARNVAEHLTNGDKQDSGGCLLWHNFQPRIVDGEYIGEVCSCCGKFIQEVEE